MKLVSIIFGAGVISAQCQNARVRREIRELSEVELHEFTEAINQLHKERKAGMQEMSSYEYFAYLHSINARRVHSTASFLPWHRYFIRMFEMELQRMNPNVTLPYWDWSMDSSEPHRSPVLSGRMMGGNGARANRCVRDGPFAGWQMSYPTSHCLRRDYDLGNRLSSFSSPEAILLDISESRFSDFSLQFEIKHGRPHNSIGGNRGDFAPMYSPNDPLFFLHHAFVDLVWDKWQQRHPNSTFEARRFGSQADIDDLLVGLDGSTIEDTFDIESSYYCYSYPPYPRLIATRRTPMRVRASASSILASNPFVSGTVKAKNVDQAISRIATKKSISIATEEFPILKAPGSLSEKFIKENNFNPKEVERVQARERALVEKLNTVSGFRSLSSIQAVINSYEKPQKEF